MGDETKNGSDWRTALPEDLRGHESLKDVKDVGSLAKAFVDTKAMVGSSLRLPGPDAGDADKASFFAKLQEKFPNALYLPKTDEEAKALEAQLWGKLGRPADEKGYTLEGVDTTGATLDAAELAKTARSLGLTKGQFKTLVQGLVKSHQQQASTVKAWQDSLKTEWGAAYQERLDAAAEHAAKLGADPTEVEAIRKGTLPPSRIKYAYANAAAVGGTGRQVADQGQGAGKLTPEEARLQIKEIAKNPAYFHAGEDPDLHDALVKKVALLMPQAHPDLV